MTPKHLLAALVWLTLASGLWSNPARAGVVYKDYTVHDDQGQDVLCDPYVVQPNDWVYKVFRQKGEIAQKDFGQFLSIFKRINPHVGDINLIRPGQRIMIPLRKLAADSLRGQSSGTVTIPFVTITGDPEPAPSGTATHLVKPGDCVSVLVHRRVAAQGPRHFRDAMARFKVLNPQIVDVNRLVVGQRVLLPALFVNEQLLTRDPEDQRDSILSSDEQEPIAGTPLETVAKVFNAGLRRQGALSFPYGGKDHTLDLGRFPLLELPGGKRFLLAGDSPLEPPVAAAQAKWPDLHLVRFSAHHGAEAIVAAIADVLSAEGPIGPAAFSDRGIDVSVRARWIIRDGKPLAQPEIKRCITPLDGAWQKTPAAVIRYLARNRIIVAEFLRDGPHGPEPEGRHRAASGPTVVQAGGMRAFVADLVTALGYRFSANVTVSFPYGGIQVAAVSNLIATAQGGAVFVDFGDLYGEGIQALQNSGVDMIQINGDDDHSTVIQKIAAALGLSCQNDPVVWACRRTKEHNISLAFPKGFRLTGKDATTDALVSFSSVDEEVAGFLAANGIQAIIIDPQGG